MTSSSVHRASRPTRQTSVWAILVVLGLSFSRFLVVCTGPHCHGTVEFAHAPGSCCQDHHEILDGRSEHDHGGDCDDDDAAKPSRCGCIDATLAIDEGPLPERFRFGFSDTPMVAVSEAWPEDPPSEQRATVLPPATGPPRTDHRTELLATTLLLI